MNAQGNGNRRIRIRALFAALVVAVKLRTIPAIGAVKEVAFQHAAIFR